MQGLGPSTRKVHLFRRVYRHVYAHRVQVLEQSIVRHEEAQRLAETGSFLHEYLGADGETPRGLA